MSKGFAAVAEVFGAMVAEIEIRRQATIALLNSAIENGALLGADAIAWWIHAQADDVMDVLGVPFHLRDAVYADFKDAHAAYQAALLAD